MPKPMTRYKPDWNGVLEAKPDGMYVDHDDALRYAEEAVREAVKVERERCIDAAFGWWAGTEYLGTIPTDVAAQGIRAALEVPRG